MLIYKCVCVGGGILCECVGGWQISVEGVWVSGWGVDISWDPGHASNWVAQRGSKGKSKQSKGVVVV